MLDKMGLTERKRSRDRTVLTMSEFGRRVPGTLRLYKWRVVAISLGHFGLSARRWNARREILKLTAHYCSTHET